MLVTSLCSKRKPQVLVMNQVLMQQHISKGLKTKVGQWQSYYKRSDSFQLIQYYDETSNELHSYNIM